MNRTPNNSTLKFAILFAFGAMFVAVPAFAQEADSKTASSVEVKVVAKKSLPEPMGFVKAKYAEAQALSAAKQDDARDTKIKALVDELIDYDDFAVRSLGDKWTKLSVEKQSEFKSLFRELGERSYTKKIGKKSFVADQTIEWDRAVKTKNGTIVSCFTRQKDVETEFEIVLHEGSDSWRIYDVLVDGASLADTYKKKYAKTIDEKGVDGIMDDMRKEIGKL